MFDHLTDEQRCRIHVNNTMRKADLEAARALTEAAEPGKWRVADVVGGLVTRAIVRHSGEPLVERASYDLAAESRALVPRLLRHVEELERGLATCSIVAASVRRDLADERAAHAATIKRQSEGATGPEHEVGLLALYVTLSAAGDVGITGTAPEAVTTHRLGEYTRFLLQRWAGGASISDVLTADSLARAKREVEERAQRRAAEAAETEALRTQLREALERVARGEVPEVLKPALKKMRDEARRAAKAAT